MRKKELATLHVDGSVSVHVDPWDYQFEAVYEDENGRVVKDGSISSRYKLRGAVLRGCDTSTAQKLSMLLGVDVVCE